MKIFKNLIFSILLISLLVFLVYFYYTFEKLSDNDFGCGCSSACISFKPTTISKIIGYILIFSSLIFTLFSLVKLKKCKKLFAIPSIALFLISNYGNGYYLFNKGACGQSLNKTEFYLSQKKIGDFAKNDAETINLDSLRYGKYNGKLLGYSFQKNSMKIFRINQKPIILKTRFLFWKIRNNTILNSVSYGLNTFRNLESEIVKGNYEFIGGKGMTEKEFIGVTLKNKKLTQEKDGTTRFKFQTD